MKESVIHYLWKNKKLRTLNFLSVDGHSIEILHPGNHNFHSGPDFTDAKIKVNGIEWHGQVEIHVKSSDWEKHHHQYDPAYNNVILHIVYDCDQPVFTASGVELLQAEIKSLIIEKNLDQVLNFIESSAEITCGNFIPEIPAVFIENQKEIAFVERLQKKSEQILDDLKRYNNDWEQVTYSAIARAMGTPVNKFAFDRLSQLIPWKRLAKEGFTPQKTEATLFHYSGLYQTQHEYHQIHQENSKLLNLKYASPVMQKSEWRFFAMRPTSYPTIKIAQLADLFHREKNIFSKIVEATCIEDLQSLFHCQASSYWDNRFHFDQVSPQVSVKKISASTIHHLIINAAIPIYFTWHHRNGNANGINNVFDFLAQLPPEINSVTLPYMKKGMVNKSAYDSQAISGLKTHFCTPKKCLSCSIGNQILSK